MGQKAPDYEAATTQDTLRLSDYQGTLLMLFSQPADFTPVCTTEFAALSEIYDELKKRNVELLGLSVDSVYSQIGSIRNCEEKMVVNIPFPIIGDLNKEVAKKYGMIHPELSKTETVRCVFIIDSESKIRAMLYYPLTTGRNMNEILRLLDALQTADKYKVATPANWRLGDPVVVPVPQQLNKQMKNSKKDTSAKRVVTLEKVTLKELSLFPSHSKLKTQNNWVVTLRSLKTSMKKHNWLLWKAL